MRRFINESSIKRIPRIAMAGSLAVILALAGSVERAEAASARQLRKALKKADEHWQEGRTAAALELYESVLADTETGAPERADALYAVAVAALTAGTQWHDATRARQVLQELAETYPRHPRSPEVRVLAGLVEAHGDAAARASELERELAELRATTVESQESQEGLAVELEELRGQLDATERRLAASRRELAAAREELARKEEALAKLTERLVGGAGDG